MRSDDFYLAPFTSLRSDTKRVRSEARGKVQPGAKRHELRARRKQGATVLPCASRDERAGCDERQACDLSSKTWTGKVECLVNVGVLG